MTHLLARVFRASTLLRAAGLFAAVALTACVNQPGSARYGGPPAVGPAPSQPVPFATSTGRRVSILLPLSGPNAEIGQAMLKAAQLAFNPASFGQPGNGELDQHDTGGTPEGAADAARAAIAEGAGLILGPLTGPETSAVSGVTRAAGVPVLAFTSDSSLSQPGVWAMGLTPAQQVRRLVLAVQAENKSRIAAVLPTNSFGDALAAGLGTATAAAGMPEPRVIRASPTFAGINQALKDVSGYNSRRGAIEAEQRAARASRDAEGRRRAAEIGQQAPPPPPMDALLLGIGGDLLSQAVPILVFYDIGPKQVRILGPATWARDAARQPDLAGAWFAAPDRLARTGFEQQYVAAYNTPARDLSSLAYDAAGIARAVSTPNGFSYGALTRPEGFAGADGFLALQPDGVVRRGLALFEIDRGGAHIIEPPPQSLGAPGI